MKKRNQTPYSKIIDFSHEQDLYASLCLTSNCGIKKRLRKKRKYYYYCEWKEHIENDILASFNTQKELEEFIRYCNLRYNTAKLVDNSALQIFAILTPIIFTILVQNYINIGANLVIFISVTEIFIAGGLAWVGKVTNLQYLLKSFWKDIIEIAESYKPLRPT